MNRPKHKQADIVNLFAKQRKLRIDIEGISEYQPFNCLRMHFGMSCRSLSYVMYVCTYVKLRAVCKPCLTCDLQFDYRWVYL
jgi:hypothetical protein